MRRALPFAVLLLALAGCGPGAAASGAGGSGGAGGCAAPDGGPCRTKVLCGLCEPPRPAGGCCCTCETPAGVCCALPVTP